jgi:hypothetical protein
MDLNELTEWLKTDIGQKWGEEFKAPLLNKRDELLTALKDSNGKLAEMDQRSISAASELAQERAALSAVLVDQELARLLRNKKVMETAIPATIAKLKESYALTVRADGANRLAIGKKPGMDETVSLNEIVSTWSTTPEAQQITLNNATGGGALGGSVSATASQTLGSKSGPSLARMSDSDFHALREKSMNREN